jgi:hypothetical protein
MSNSNNENLPRDDLMNLCMNIFTILQRENPRMKSMVIQYRDNNATVGRNVDGKFSPIYFTGNEINDIINRYMSAINAVFDMIKIAKPRTKSYIIHYVPQEETHLLEICANRIGSKSYESSRLFEPITW